MLSGVLVACCIAKLTWPMGLSPAGLGQEYRKAVRFGPAFVGICIPASRLSWKVGYYAASATKSNSPPDKSPLKPGWRSVPHCRSNSFEYGSLEIRWGREPQECA